MAILILLLPFARLAGHSLASSLGFVGVASITLLPLKAIEKLSSFGLLQPDHVMLLNLAELGILGLEIVTLIIVVMLYSGLFVVEQWRAVRTMMAGKHG